ncbi:MAG: hypothetical protein NVSMB44_41670 [Ktedonobacteraceae bacterium]
MSLLRLLDAIHGRARARPYGRIMAIITPLLTLTFVISLVAFQLLHFTFAEAYARGGSPTLAGTLTPRIAHSHLDMTVNPQQHVELSLGLRPRNQTALDRALRAIVLPGSESPRQVMQGAEYIQQFSPSEAIYSSLQRFLENGGLTVTHTYPHRLLLDATGTMAQVEQLFQISINVYTDTDGQTYYANSDSPVLPVWLAGQVLSINGLNNATHWYHDTYHTYRGTGKTSAQGAQGTQNCPPTDGNGLSPDQFAHAYHMNSLYSAHNQGEGETIALFELGNLPVSDLNAYTACFGQSHTPLQVIKGGSRPLPANAEGATDAELILGAAPLLDALRIYEAANDESGYLSQWAQIIEDAPAVVASSWSQCEMNLTPQIVLQENVFFQLAALQGQTILAAAGAPGSIACPGDSNPTPLNTGVVDPAAQPFVTAVGGTGLMLHATSYDHETTWDTSTAGGGLSRYWTLPDWQHMAGVPDPVYSSQSPCAHFTGNSGNYCREVPDVALNASTEPGYWTYCTASASCDASRPWTVTGGTSAATSLWAVLVALTNQLYSREDGATARLGFLNPLLYQLANDPVKYAQSFQHVVMEMNAIGQHSGPLYPATIGYNMASGLGSYNAFMLATNLAELAHTLTIERKQYAENYIIVLQRKP